MQAQPSPPVPQPLREMLSDYPELIERLQEVLNLSAAKSRRSPLMPLDDAIDSLDNRLEKFASEAMDELRAAEASGNSDRIARATVKEKLLSRARHKRIWIRDVEFYKCFEHSFDELPSIPTSA